MKTWKRALALVLALVMALSLVALPSFAEGEETGGGNDGMPYIEENGHGGKVEKDGLVMSKTIKKTGDSQFLLTLEAFATGSTTTTTSTDPVDIVLVLDVSGSMDDYMETYSISPNGTYYYYDEGNIFGIGAGYKRAYYCSSCQGWYTKEHGRHSNGTQLTPKTSANGSGIQFYVTKMETLKTAVKGFVNSVSAKSPDSNIAIVKFGAEINNEIGNDFNGSGWNYTQIVKELTPASNAEALNTAVDGLQAAGYTPSYLGLQLAKGIIEKDPNTDRQKVVVLFTDGEPNGVDSTSGFETSAANAAIANSKSIKDAGATVYTIGCFNTTYPDTDNVPKYMNRVSSNYPDATNMNDGTRGVGDFYKTVSSASELESIFKDISQTIGGTTVKLTSTSVLRDVISDSFKLPEGADKNSITAYSVDCMAVNDDGTYTWSANRDDTMYSVTVEGKTINVTDFDYAANWVGKDTTTGKMHIPAKKLVVEIPIVPEQDATGSVKTNGDASGIYADSTVKDPVEKFPSPVVYIPYFTVVHVASTVNDQGHNEGKRTGETHHPVWCNRPFNLTSVVTNGYLYGGSFTGENCDTVQTYGNGENPTAFTPQDKAEYFIWEVPDYYLRPANYYVWRHLPENNGQKTVVRLYPLTSVDRMLYKEVGFQINGTDYVSGTNNQEFDDSVGSAGTAQLYQMVKAVQNGQPYMTMYVNKGKINATAVGTDVSEDKTVNGTPIDEGFIGGLRLPQALFDQFAAGTPVTYRPYWITLDGVKVLGVRDRTSTFEAGSTQPKDSSNKYAAEYSYVSAASTQAMSFAEYFTMDDSQPVVDESLTVTVVDGSNTTQVKVAPNGSVRDQVAYQAPAGKVFAGWFADQAYTTPADLDQVTQDTTVYAKYVSDSYLDLAYSRTGLFRLRGVTLISAVDNPANYQASGFMVNGDKLNVSYASRYRIFKTPASQFGAARNAKLMLADKSLGGTGTLEVTPYWVTLDGTQVLGQTHTLHYNTRTIWE